MVYHSPAALDATFSALGDATRRSILARLSRGDAMITELAAPYKMSLPGISKHLRVLEAAGLLRRTVDGRVHRCRLEAAPMKDAAAWMHKYRVFWEGQFDALEKYLKENPECQPKRLKSGVRLKRRARGSSPRSPIARN